jgi:apolipoprotein N-acyltransferase
MNADALALPTGAAGRVAVVLRRRRTIGRIDAVGIAAPTAIALSILSGILYATGFPPLSWSIAPWLALVPLLVASAVLSPLRAAMAGMCWAMSVAAGVAWFLPAMLSGYFGLAPAPCWLATLAVVGGLHGVYVSGYATWVAWLARRRLANPVLLAGGWLVCEFARAHDGLSSPWALAAYSQLRWTRLIQIADLAGPYGIGMLVAGANACLAAWLMPALRGRRPWRATATIAAALVGTCLYGQWRLGQTFADGEVVRVAVVQGGPPSAHEAQRAKRLARHVELTTSGADPHADVIVWPEHALDAYLEEPSSTHDTVLRLSQVTRADLILGGPHYAPSSSGTRYHNSAYLVRAGRVVARYDKHRLVPFAEEGRWRWLLGNESTSYTPGSGAFILPVTAIRVGTLLCVEAMFPDLVRQAVRQGAEVLVNLSNDAWFGHAEPARHQLEIATLRAVESRRYLVRAAATGFSAVIDPYGRTVAESGFDTHQVLNATVRASHVRTPYERRGDTFAWVVIAAVVGASLRPLLVPAASNHRRRIA